LIDPDTLRELLMAQSRIGRSAVTVGLLVLAVLIGGRMIGSWHNRQQLSSLANAHSRAVAGHPAGAAGGSPPQPSPSAAPGGAAASAKPSPTSKVQPAGRASTRPAAPRPRTARPADATFGAKRTTGTSAVALTFDDGPDPTWTPQMLDLLRQQGLKATFCLVGVHVRDHPDLVARIVREGHTLCNHSWQHDLNLGTKTPAQISADLSRTSAEIRKAVPNARIPYYRQPGGKWTATIVSIAKQMGMTPLGWAVDPSDWDKPGTSAIINRVMDHTHAGSIVLMHDGGGDRSQTLAACRTLFPWLKQRYRLVALR
jgi:peptidoglycan-N-acetylglucosamine deacetylase